MFESGPPSDNSISYPGLEECGGGTKIPTVIAYDLNGAIAAIGAEVNSTDSQQRSGWVISEWFVISPSRTASLDI
jgi:hypothetical protein